MLRNFQINLTTVKKRQMKELNLMCRASRANERENLKNLERDFGQ